MFRDKSWSYSEQAHYVFGCNSDTVRWDGLISKNIMLLAIWLLDYSTPIAIFIVYGLFRNVFLFYLFRLTINIYKKI